MELLQVWLVCLSYPTSFFFNHVWLGRIFSSGNCKRFFGVSNPIPHIKQSSTNPNVIPCIHRTVTFNQDLSSYYHIRPYFKGIFPYIGLIPPIQVKMAIDLPSGKRLHRLWKITMENHGKTHETNGNFPQLRNKLPEGTSCCIFIDYLTPLILSHYENYIEIFKTTNLQFLVSRSIAFFKG